MNEWDPDAVREVIEKTRNYLLKANAIEGEMHTLKASSQRMYRSYRRGMWVQIGVATFNVIMSVAFRWNFTWIDSMCLTFSTCFAALMWSWGQQTKMKELMIDLSIVESKMYRSMGEAHLESLESQFPNDSD